MSPIAAPSSVPTAGRRVRRDITGLEHLLLAPRERRDASQAAGPAERSIQDAFDPTGPTTVPVQVVAAATVTAAEPVVPSRHPDLEADPEPAEREEPATAPLAPEALPHAVDSTPRTIDVTPAPARPRTSVSAPRQARASVSSPSDPRQRVMPRLGRTSSSSQPFSRKRTIVNTSVMVATAGLVATLALPAYAYTENDGLPLSARTASSQLGIQSLTVDGVNSQSSTRDGYTTTGDMAAMDSTNGTTVSPTVQALAAELMADVASGKLVGSVPDHIAEIRNLSNGVAVPGCGVDYRVLQTIKVAVDNFDKVGVSDINRHCTNQIEGAGTASSHYKDGGGHAVDFYILNGHGLTGADSDSLKLISLLDPLVPKGSGLGQASCGRSISLSNFAPFDDTCTHLHVDFGAARGVSLGS
ncbi:hypothetical protein [Subtercola boreus]|uniref:hypothetical protein n=1 Tax=Subtercola boreus TaxID=120213 RepID=UPI0011C044FE|nr:hypothetical protein [Subtercola boreus]